MLWCGKQLERGISGYPREQTNWKLDWTIGALTKIPSLHFLRQNWAVSPPNSSKIPWNEGRNRSNFIFHVQYLQHLIMGKRSREEVDIPEKEKRPHSKKSILADATTVDPSLALLFSSSVSSISLLYVLFS